MTPDDIIGTISGYLTGLNLASFLQMIEMEQKTCTIKIFTKKNIGHIFFLNGTLIDAETINLKHRKALYAILSWNDIVIEVEKNIPKRENSINLPLMHILIESAQHADETKKVNTQNDPENPETVSQKNIPVQVLNNKNFCLEIGIKLLIDFDDLVVPFKSSLVGMEDGRYLILKAPGPIGRVDHDLFKVEDLIVKSLYKGTIYAFRSKVINLVSKPAKLMFIEYPLKIEHHELRLHKRFQCNIGALSELNSNEHGGTIKNISKGGCFFTIAPFSTDNDLSHELLNTIIPFQCRFPGSKGEVNFKGEIRNTIKKPGEIGIGIKFVHSNSNDEVKNIIDDYIQLIEYSSQNV